LQYGPADSFYQRGIIRLGAGFMLAAFIEFGVESGAPSQIIASALVAMIIGLFVGYSPSPGRAR